MLGFVPEEDTNKMKKCLPPNYVDYYEDVHFAEPVKFNRLKAGKNKYTDEKALCQVYFRSNYHLPMKLKGFPLAVSAYSYANSHTKKGSKQQQH
jgi:hypothetical protein